MSRSIKLAKDVEEFIYRRLDEVLEWYKGCFLLEETKENIHRDIDSVLRETSDKFGLKYPLPFTFRVELDETGICIVTAISRDKN